MNKDKKIQNILDKMEITRAINTARLENAKFSMNEKEIEKEINLLNTESQREKKIKKSGATLYLLSVLGLIASTSLSISAGLNMYKQHQFAFVITIIFVQLVIFKVSTSTTIIKQHFSNHYIKVKFMQYGLLAVIIFYNYNFFYPYIADKGFLLKTITFILCFLMDFSTMQFVSLAFDQKHLNYSKKDIQENRSILGMIIFNLTYKARRTALEQYNQNIADYKQIIKPEKIEIEVIENKMKSIEKPKEIILLKDPQHEVEVKQIKDSKVKNKVLKLSDKFKNKKFTKKSIRVDVEQTKIDKNLRTKSIQNLEQKYNKIKDYLITEYKANDYIKSFRTKFKLTVTEYRKVLDQLKKEDIVYTDNKKTYLKAQLKAVK